MGLLTPINTNIITSLMNYINNYVTYKLSSFILNTNNTVTGAQSVTLNKLNGIVTYTFAAAAASVTYYNLTNSTINSNSYIVPTIKVNAAEPAVLLLGGYFISGTTITFYVYNASVTPSGSFKIHFQVAG
jgi:hypothetical protein